MQAAVPRPDPPAADANPWRGVFGSAAVYCAVWVCGIAWAAAATPPSTCGNCRRDVAAQAALLWEAPWFLAAAVAAWVLAEPSSGEARVARCAVAVALALWVVSAGFVRGWW